MTRERKAEQYKRFLCLCLKKRQARNPSSWDTTSQDGHSNVVAPWGPETWGPSFCADASALGLLQ